MLTNEDYEESGRKFKKKGN